MKILQRKRDSTPEEPGEQSRPPTDEAPEPEPQPAHDQAQPEERSKQGYFGVFKRAAKNANGDHITNLAAALAYYAFLAIPATLLIAAGVFGLVAGPGAVTTVMDKLHGIVPAQVTDLIRGSLTRLTTKQSTSITLIAVGGVLALWSVSGAMQNVMWALNLAFGREESRGFVKRRLVAAAMAVFALVAFALVFGLLVLGPHISGWIGDAVGDRTAVEIAWWVAQWPILIGGLFIAFAVILRLGPNHERRHWRFASLGAGVAVVIWLLASGAFAFFVSRFGSYNKAWGSLSAVVVMLTWLWLSAVALLFGAEIDAEAERSRAQETG